MVIDSDFGPLVTEKSVTIYDFSCSVYKWMQILPYKLVLQN